MRLLLLTVALALITSASSTKLAASGQSVQYRVIDGQLAKRIDSLRVCTMLWSDDEEVLLIDFHSRTYLMRTGPGDIGRACRIP